MISEVWQSITDYLKDKAVSPLTGAFCLSWLAWNYRLPVALFSDLPIPKRFGYIDYILYPGWEDILLRGFLLPAVSAMIYLIWYHKPAMWFYEKKLTQRRELLEKRNQVEKTRLLTEEEAERIRTRHEREVGRLETRLREATQRNQVLEEAATSTGDRVVKLEERVTEFEAAERGLPRGNDQRDEAIRKLLLNQAWVLHFNPKNGGRKVVVFGREGGLVEGGNQNEHSWSVRSGLLHFANDSGEIFSVFAFDANQRAFLMLDDESPKAIKGQVLAHQ